MQEDAKRIAASLKTSYQEEVSESPAISQLTEMLEYLVVENHHEVLGVAPKSLQVIFDLLRDKSIIAKTDFEDLETQKEQYKEIELLRQHCQELEDDRERLATYEQSFIEA